MTSLTPTGATAGVDLDKLQRFNNRGGLMNPEASGLYVRYEDVARRAQPRVAEQADDEENAVDSWRRLALQFDEHRMQALGHLRAMLKDPAKHAPVVTEFLKAPPLSGEEVLAQRIAALTHQAAPAQPSAANATASEGGSKCQYPNCGCTSRATCNYNYDRAAPRNAHADDSLKANSLDGQNAADLANKSTAPTSDQQAGAVAQITDPDALEVGREYWLRDKKTGKTKISECREDGAWRYFESRLWATPANNQAMGRFDIFGPLPVRTLAAPAAIEQAGAQPVAQADYVLMPKRLTAENGAKGALSGEFKESVRVTCYECEGSGDDENGDECPECKGDSTVDQAVTVGWDTIKDIYKAAVSLLAAPTPATDQDALDAKRYRWLRNEAWGCSKHGYKDVHVCQFGPGVLKSAITELAEEALDAAIDAAMSASHTEGDQNA